MFKILMEERGNPSCIQYKGQQLNNGHVCSLLAEYAKQVKNMKVSLENDMVEYGLKDKAIASLDDCQKSQSHSLNRLSMENKELKKQNEYLKSSDHITYLEIQIRKLKEENKKLQSEINWENIKYGTLKILYDENKELKQEIEALKMEISELRESEKDNYNITDGLW